MALTEKHFKILKKKQFEPFLLQLLFEQGFLDKPDDSKSFTEKAKKTIENVQELSPEIYSQLKNIWPKEYLSSYDAVNKQFKLLCKNNIDLTINQNSIVPMAEVYLHLARYCGELKYFFWKDFESRYLKALDYYQTKRIKNNDFQPRSR